MDTTWWCSLGWKLVALLGILCSVTALLYTAVTCVAFRLRHDAFTDDYDAAEVRRSPDGLDGAEFCVMAVGLVLTVSGAFCWVSLQRQRQRRQASAASSPISPALRPASAGSLRAAADECPICLEPLDVERGDVVVTPCEHVYHLPCILKWMSSRVTCPMCVGVIAARRTIEL